MKCPDCFGAGVRSNEYDYYLDDCKACHGTGCKGFVPGAEPEKPAVDLEACAKAACDEHYGYWEQEDPEEKKHWRAVAAAVLKAAGVKT